MDADYLRQILFYDADTGVFIWRQSGMGRRIGDMAGTIGHGYRIIMIDWRRYRAHRLAWLYMTGEWAAAEIDHINLDKADNRWSNLRSATRCENMANTCIRSNNTSRLKGVYWHKRAGKWMASIQADNKQRYLGLFDCPAAAQFAYIIAADKYFGEFARRA